MWLYKKKMLTIIITIIHNLFFRITNQIERQKIEYKKENH